MPIGPGKYDAECTEIRERLKAEAIVMIVFDGNRGNGFSVQASLELLAMIPDILEMTAQQIRESVANDIRLAKTGGTEQ